MKLLLDQNLSPKLVNRIIEIFPDSTHVHFLNLDEAPDTEVWEYARVNDFTLVTKDADFGDLSVLRGFPPKVIWIKRGNCKTSDIEQILLDNQSVIRQLEKDKVLGLITLF